MQICMPCSGSWIPIASAHASPRSSGGAHRSALVWPQLALTPPGPLLCPLLFPRRGETAPLRCLVWRYKEVRPSRHPPGAVIRDKLPSVLIAVPPRGCAGRSGLRPLAAPPSQGSPRRDHTVSPTLHQDGPWGPVWYLRAGDSDAFPVPVILIVQSRIPTRTVEVLLQIGAWGLTLLPQPHRSRQLWYFGKGQCRAGQACREILALFLPQRKKISLTASPQCQKCSARLCHSRGERELGLRDA